MTRGHLLATMPASEFREWQILEAIEPFGEMGNYFRSGIIASTIANVNRQASREPFSPWDFVPKIEEEAKVMSPEALRQVMLGLAAAQDAYLKRKEANNVRNDPGT